VKINKDAISLFWSLAELGFLGTLLAVLVLGFAGLLAYAIWTLIHELGIPPYAVLWSAGALVVSMFVFAGVGWLIVKANEWGMAREHARQMRVYEEAREKRLRKRRNAEKEEARESLSEGKY